MAGRKFQPSRLKEVRDARSIPTLTALADRARVNVSAASRWEKGLIEPTPEHAATLAAELDVRLEFFYRVPFSHGSSPAFFRSLARARKRDLARQRARMDWLREISIVLQHYVSLPPLNLPDLLAGRSYRQLREEDIEQIARDLRQHWRLGGAPIVNIVDVLERNGIVVGQDDTGSTDLDGLCRWSEIDGRPYILLANDKMSHFRRQMDAAHELAHAVLHRGVGDDDLARDFALIEGQAFRLASAILMPADTFPLAVREPSLSMFQRIKSTWHVSIKAMIRRCRDLDMIDREQATQFYKYYSAKGWNREEPLDRITPVERPKMLASALQMIVENGRRTRAELTGADFVFSGRDVAMLVGLPEDWFSRGEVIPLRMTDAKGPPAYFGMAEVIQLPDGKRRA